MGTLLEKRLRCLCFPVNFVKFLQTLPGGCLFTMSALYNILDRKSQNVREFLLSLSFQSFIFVFSFRFLPFSHYELQRPPTPYYSSKKETIEKRKSLNPKASMYSCIHFRRFFALSSFFVQSYTVRFCLKREFILLLEV